MEKYSLIWAHNTAADLRQCRVFVAVPIARSSHVPDFGEAAIAMREIIRMGAAPMVPPLSFLVESLLDLSLRMLVDNLLMDIRCGEWLKTDLAWIEAADVVLRLPGKSAGADCQCQHAERFGIPVVYSLVDLRKILEQWSASKIHGGSVC